MVAINRNPPTYEELLFSNEVEVRLRERILWSAGGAAWFGVLCPIMVAVGLQASAVFFGALVAVHLFEVWRYRRQLCAWEHADPDPELLHVLRVYRGEP